MRILVMSDNHHDWKSVEKILSSERYDFSIHLGDAEVDERKVKLNFDKYVAGNHDQFSIHEDFFNLEGIQFGILHGHTQGISVMKSFEHAFDFAKVNNLDVVLHGHTHIVADESRDGIRVICPGSITYPRSMHGSTYMVITLEKEKILKVVLKHTRDL